MCDAACVRKLKCYKTFTEGYTISRTFGRTTEAIRPYCVGTVEVSATLPDEGGEEGVREV